MEPVDRFIGIFCAVVFFSTSIFCFINHNLQEWTNKEKQRAEERHHIIQMLEQTMHKVDAQGRTIKSLTRELNTMKGGKRMASSHANPVLPKIQVSSADDKMANFEETSSFFAGNQTPSVYCSVQSDVVRRKSPYRHRSVNSETAQKLFNDDALHRLHRSLSQENSRSVRLGHKEVSKSP